MSLPVVFRESADEDVHEIVAWYETQQLGLGFRFRTSLDLIVALIGEHPLACPIVWPQVRRALVHGFPYSLFYTVLPDRVRVLACLHQHRSPRRIRQRIRTADPAR